MATPRTRYAIEFKTTFLAEYRIIRKQIDELTVAAQPTC